MRMRTRITGKGILDAIVGSALQSPARICSYRQLHYVVLPFRPDSERCACPVSQRKVACHQNRLNAKLAVFLPASSSTHTARRPPPTPLLPSHFSSEDRAGALGAIEICKMLWYHVKTSVVGQPDAGNFALSTQNNQAPDVSCPLVCQAVLRLLAVCRSPRVQ
jgi:hypothetical protein